MAKQNYLCIQRSQAGGRGQREAPSPEQMQQMYAMFNAWREKYQDSIVDMGGRLGKGKLVTADGIVDGPSAEMKELIGGYMIVSGASLEEAADIARQCPGLVGPRSSLEIREITTP